MINKNTKTAIKYIRATAGELVWPSLLSAESYYRKKRIEKFTTIHSKCDLLFEPKFR